MNTIRLLAAMLAIASVMIACILVLVPTVGSGVIGALVAAGAILAAVAPFEAPEPPARTRVAVACLAYTGIAALAAALATLREAPVAVPVIVAVMALCGGVLTVWAFRTRKRRRKIGWKNYFDS